MEQERITEPRYKNNDTPTNKPHYKCKCGNVQGTVWENKTVKDGNEISILSVSIQRGYKDKEGNWKNTTSFQLNDIPKVRSVLQRIYEDLLIKTGD